MKKQFLPKILYILLLFIQVGLVTAVFVVNYLSGVKAGVYRHVYTRRMHYMEGLYNSTSIQWQSLLIACLCILLFIPSRALRLRSYNWPTARDSYTRGYSKTDAQPMHDCVATCGNRTVIHDL